MPEHKNISSRFQFCTMGFYKIHYVQMEQKSYITINANLLHYEMYLASKMILIANDNQSGKYLLCFLKKIKCIENYDFKQRFYFIDKPKYLNLSKPSRFQENILNKRKLMSFILLMPQITDFIEQFK